MPDPNSTQDPNQINSPYDRKRAIKQPVGSPVDDALNTYLTSMGQSNNPYTQSLISQLTPQK